MHIIGRISEENRRNVVMSLHLVKTGDPKIIFWTTKPDANIRRCARNAMVGRKMNIIL
jgi:hypothetical protein